MPTKLEGFSLPFVAWDRKAVPDIKLHFVNVVLFASRWELLVGLFCSAGMVEVKITPKNKPSARRFQGNVTWAYEELKYLVF